MCGRLKIPLNGDGNLTIKAFSDWEFPGGPVVKNSMLPLKGTGV